MKLYNPDHRTIAALCFTQQAGDIKAATKQFITELKSMGLDIPKDPAKFIQYWGHRWAVQHSTRGSSSNSGRQRKLRDAELAQVLDIIVNWRRDGRTGPYRSMKEVKRCNQIVRDIIRTADCSMDTLRRSLKRFCPELVYKKLWVKPKLTDQHKEDRYNGCCELLEYDEDIAETVVFLDAKTMYMTITDRKGWVLLGEEDVFETNHNKSKKNPIVLKYYAAVNYRLGKVELIFITGTTGMKANRDPNRPYKVSQYWCNLGGVLTAICCSTSLIAFNQRARRLRS